MGEIWGGFNQGRGEREREEGRERHDNDKYETSLENGIDLTDWT